MRLSTNCLLMLAGSLICMVALSSSAQAQEEILPGTEFTVGIIITPPNDVSATYDAATGEVHIGVNGTFLLIRLDGGPFLLGNLVQTTPFGEPAKFETGGLGFVNVGGLPSGLFYIGNILPADPTIRTAAQFLEVYPNHEVIAAAASELEIRRRFNVIPAAIPEPGTLLSLIVVSTIGLMRRRRK